MQAIIAKNKEWFNSLSEIHSSVVSEPLVIDTHFTCTMTYDITMKEFGRMKFSEICVYEVKGGKIVYEHFFYRMRN
ncbi:SnoaL-like domain-containing protein [Mucilaginibacter limnophilus]|uniref:SnoaL-like domain-containing protein n=1 Tax=Mucilaginibacter limnophilus TaxID=1932778 RepID=UPI002938D079|nr:SnoaL-like domain-containing protein [Mucilaginibacter limnophilus]